MVDPNATDRSRETAPRATRDSGDLYAVLRPWLYALVLLGVVFCSGAHAAADAFAKAGLIPRRIKIQDAVWRPRLAAPPAASR
jgi:hypothetical protein